MHLGLSLEEHAAWNCLSWQLYRILQLGSSAPKILFSTRNLSREVLFQYTEYRKLLLRTCFVRVCDAHNMDRAGSNELPGTRR